MGGGGEAFQEGFGSLILDEVGLDGIGEGGDVGEVCNAIIYWFTYKGKGFLMGCLMVATSGGMIRQLGWGAAITRFGCSFIELTGAGVSDADVSCTPNVMMLFWGAEMPKTVGATIR